MPAITDYPAFVIAVLLFLAIPGPGNLAIISSTAQGRVRGGRRFYLEVEGLGEAELQFDPLGHGTAIIEAIDRRAPRASIYMAQVFDQRGVTSALQIAAAIHWLLEQDVRLINLSLGLRQDRDPLLEVLVAAPQGGRLARVARGAVRPGQLVQSR